MTRGRAIAAAIVGRAQVRAALQHLARYPDLGLARVVAGVLTAAAEVMRDAAGFGSVSFMPGCVPVGGPLPDIADHIEEAISIGRIDPHRRSALVAICCEVLVREGALP